MLKKSDQLLNIVYVGQLLSKKLPPISASHKSFLEHIFANNAHPSKTTIKKIAHELGLGPRTVCNWFRLERMRVTHGKYQQTKSIGEFVCVHSALVSIKIVVDTSSWWLYITFS